MGLSSFTKLVFGTVLSGIMVAHFQSDGKIPKFDHKYISIFQHV